MMENPERQVIEDLDAARCSLLVDSTERQRHNPASMTDQVSFADSPNTQNKIDSSLFSKISRLIPPPRNEFEMTGIL